MIIPYDSVSFIIYDSSGRIKRYGYCVASDLQYQTKEGEYLLEHERVDEFKYYISNSEVVPRPVFEEEVIGTTISGLPIPTTLVIDQIEYEVTDGTAELDFSLPGSYIVRLESFPYQEKEIEVIKT